MAAAWTPGIAAFVTSALRILTVASARRSAVTSTLETTVASVTAMATPTMVWTNPKLAKMAISHQRIITHMTSIRRRRARPTTDVLGVTRRLQATTAITVSLNIILLVATRICNVPVHVFIVIGTCTVHQVLVHVHTRVHVLMYSNCPSTMDTCTRHDHN